MDNQSFNELFETKFAAPLIVHGFQMVGRGNSMHFVDDNRELLILRQGGRFARPGVVRSVIFFRHTFLRPIDSNELQTTPISASDCPRKLIFDDFGGWFRPKINYKPQNSGRWRTHDFQYSSVDVRRASAHLEELLAMVIKRILPWMRTLTEEGELMQIKRFGENAWCEKRWIEDYEKFLSKLS